MGFNRASATDRIAFMALYVAAGAVVLWTGFQLTDYGLEMRFVNSFIKPWQVGLAGYDANQGIYPVFDGHNHVAYMEALIERMRQNGITPPDSNVAAAYRYRLNRFAGRDEDVFLLCLSGRIMIYGLSQKSLKRLDQAVDQTSGLASGQLIGRPGKSQTSYIGQWRI